MAVEAGEGPAAASPPAMPEAASPAVIARITVRLARAFAAKIRRGERTATSRWRQVPSRSSAANTSPAVSEVSSGSAQVHEKPSTTSDPAQPDACIQRPKTVTAGSEVCRLTAATNTAGAIQHAASTSRIRHWDSSLTSSKR